MRRRRQGRRLWHRHRAAVPGAARRPAAGPSSSPISREGAPRPRASRRTPTIYVLNGLLPGTAPALRRASACARCSARTTEIAEWAAFARHRTASPAGGAARRHRHEPARPVARRGAGARAAALPSRLSRIGAADEPFRLRPTSRTIRSTRARSRRSRELARHCPGHAGIARQFLRHLPRQRAPHYDLVRPGYALYGGNPTPGIEPTRCSRWSS